VSELYWGRQFVGMDLHRRRSVLVRMTESGEHLETVRILNDRDRLADVMSRAGECPRWYSRRPTGGTGQPMRSPSSVRRCTWPIRWG
jgi:hypothetical protein